MKNQLVYLIASAVPSKHGTSGATASKTRYVLTESGSGVQHCFVRAPGRKAELAPCDSAEHPYTPLPL